MAANVPAPSAGGRPATALLLAAFLSGASALIFETLWFRLTGLALGNGVWASALVLGAFMTGLALGNGLAARRASGWRRPASAYAALEATIGISGLLLVLLLPGLGRLLAPALSPVLDQPLPLNLIRLAAALALMIVPACAMGATLPTLVRALEGDRDFGRLLGRVYGWNTLGAVAGALAGEAWLIASFGIQGTAGIAALLNLVAAFVALRLAPGGDVPLDAAPPSHASGGAPLVAAAAGCGAILLALEVVWLRFISLHVLSTSLTFATVLAVVLAGIAGGSFAAGWWLRRSPTAARHVPAMALIAGAMVVLAYRLAGAPRAGLVDGVMGTLRVSAGLILPVSVLSGALFVLLGAALQTRIGAQSRATGILTLANTVGAVAGSTLAGFLLLPRLGIDRSLLLLTLAYGPVAALAWLGGERGRGRAVLGPIAAAGTVFVVASASFPHGQAEANIRSQAAVYAGDVAQVVAVREGVLETLVYLRRDQWGEALEYRLLTNGFSMSATGFGGARYMKMFVYLPVALRPDPRSALLICYGVGNTAQALTSTESLERIDVVDISPDILEMSSIVFPPGKGPLDDPRVKVHVQDGRFFLQATRQRFDLITAEPPPPKAAGVVNLYSRQYFELVYDRLTEGGVTTHWLPVYQLSPADGRSIIAAFCAVFEDCTLWTGTGPEWVLAGSRGLAAPPDPRGFTAQWSSAAAPDMHALGFETPEQLGTTFIGDAAFLRAATRGTLPLDDDFPQRLSPRSHSTLDPLYVAWMDARATQARFATSAFVARHWPPALRQSTLASFPWQDTLNSLTLPDDPLLRMERLRQVLQQSSLRVLPLLVMTTTEAELQLAERAARRGDPDPAIVYYRGLRALSERDYPAAAVALAEAEARGAPIAHIRRARVLATALAGDHAAALALAQDDDDFRRWAAGAFPPGP